MSSLSSLRITECPAAFAEFARKHNALCALLEAMTGADGATVTVAENNIVITAGTDLTARVAALETLTTGMSRQTAELCPSGTVTILST